MDNLKTVRATQEDRMYIIQARLDHATVYITAECKVSGSRAMAVEFHCHEAARAFENNLPWMKKPIPCGWAYRELAETTKIKEVPVTATPIQLEA